MKLTFCRDTICTTENNAKILFDLSEENIKYPLGLWMDQMPTPEQVGQRYEKHQDS